MAEIPLGGPLMKVLPKEPCGCQSGQSSSLKKGQKKVMANKACKKGL